MYLEEEDFLGEKCQWSDIFCSAGQYHSRDVLFFLWASGRVLAIEQCKCRLFLQSYISNNLVNNLWALGCIFSWNLLQIKYVALANVSRGGDVILYYQFPLVSALYIGDLCWIGKYFFLFLSSVECAFA